MHTFDLARKIKRTGGFLLKGGGRNRPSGSMFHGSVRFLPHNELGADKRTQNVVSSAPSVL